MLWIALHLPSLSLESFTATLAGDSDAVVEGFEGSEGAAPPRDARPVALIDAHRIVCADKAAQALGIKPGLKRATALALAPRLTLGQADARRDADSLQPVAHAALAFTPQVVVARAGHPADAPHTVLLEVEASLRYFGGLRRLLQRLERALEPFGHVVHCASAPTAQGAALLARHHPRHHCGDLAGLRQALDALPVWLLGPGREHWEALQGMGLKTIADLRSLPRSGLTRRFGESMLAELDGAFGLCPDPRTPISLAPTFESRLELFARADTSEQLLHGAAILLARLVAWLAAQHAFVRGFTLVMQHESRWRKSDDTPAATSLDIALAEPSRDSGHLLSLLRERLGRIELPAPTLELQLQAADIARRAAPNAELFPTPRSEGESLTRLIERLQARLGPEQVQRLTPVDDHRPERANAWHAADAASALRSAVRPARGVASGRLPRAAPSASGAAGAAGASSAGAAGLSTSAGGSGAFSASASRGFTSSADLGSAGSGFAGSGSSGPANASVPSDSPGSAAASGSLNSPGSSIPSSGSSKPSDPARGSSAGSRPVWLMSEPQSLPERGSQPWLDGRPLQLLSGPERIEAGWWDDALAERDYFVAQTADGALVWIYRARLPLATDGLASPGWFMQGRFG